MAAFEDMACFRLFVCYSIQDNKLLPIINMHKHKISNSVVWADNDAREPSAMVVRLNFWLMTVNNFWLIYSSK